MTVPTLSSITPPRGPTTGGNVVRLTGTSFAPWIDVQVGGAPLQVAPSWSRDGLSHADLCMPAGGPGPADLRIRNLDETGAPIWGEDALEPHGYAYERPHLLPESDLTRVVRALLRDLKTHLLDEVGLAASVEYDDTPADGLNVVALAKLPSLVLSGPTARENRTLATNVLRERPLDGDEAERLRAPYTVDLAFRLTGASSRTTELLNLIAALVPFLSGRRWLEVARDPDAPDSGSVRYELDPDGELRTRLDAGGGKADVRVFTCGLVVRGFDLADGLAFERTRRVEETLVRGVPLAEGEPG
jgi:hypothetical protein